VQFFPDYLSSSRWPGGSDDFILSILGSRSYYFRPPSGTPQHQGFASQFLSGSAFGLAHDDGSFSGALDAGFQLPINGFTNNHGYGPFDASVGFSASSAESDSSLADTIPGFTTDAANFRGADDFPPFGMRFDDAFNAPEFQANPGMLGISGPVPPIQSTAPALQPPSAHARIPCSILGCLVSFNRDGDRIRHEASVHGLNQVFQLYLCPIFTCPKSQGAGYTRKDKLTEHMWKKHSGLGYVKRVP
jgi:hypothetical protein